MRAEILYLTVKFVKSSLVGGNTVLVQEYIGDVKRENLDVRMARTPLVWGRSE
jgi:hypothetical protein